MAKTNKLTVPETVAEYYQKLQHPLLPVVIALKDIILATNPAIAEQIKWNSPSFYFTGPMLPFNPKEYKRDLVVFNLHKPDTVLLVFPTGSRIIDPANLLQGNYPDGRRIARFDSMDMVKDRKADLQAIIVDCLRQVV